MTSMMNDFEHIKLNEDISMISHNENGSNSMDNSVSYFVQDT
jgi:hypothetical protein